MSDVLFWKLCVGFDLLIAIGYWRAVSTGRQRLDRFDIVAIPASLFGSVGLILYAFSLPPMSRLLWRLFLPLFVVSAAWEITMAVKDEPLEPAKIIGAGAGLLLAGLTAVALYRLGGSHWLGV